MSKKFCKRSTVHPNERKAFKTTTVLPSPLSCLHIHSCLIYAVRKKNMQISAGTLIKQHIDILFHTHVHNTNNSLFLLPLSSFNLSPCRLRTRGQWMKGRCWWPKNNSRSLQLSSAESSHPGQRSPAASPWKMPASVLCTCRCHVVLSFTFRYREKREAQINTSGLQSLPLLFILLTYSSCCPRCSSCTFNPKQITTNHCCYMCKLFCNHNLLSSNAPDITPVYCVYRFMFSAGLRYWLISAYHRYISIGWSVTKHCSTEMPKIALWYLRYSVTIT